MKSKPSNWLSENMTVVRPLKFPSKLATKKGSVRSATCQGKGDIGGWKYYPICLKFCEPKPAGRIVIVIVLKKFRGDITFTIQTYCCQL